MSGLHPLLRRQIARHLSPGAAADASVRRFIRAVDEAYQQADVDRTLLERSLDLSSQELLQANSEMRAVIEAFPDLFFWIAPDGTVLGCRAQDPADLLLPADELVGRRLQDLPDRDSAARLTRALDDLNGDAHLVTVDYSITRADGPQFYEARLVRLHQRQILVIVRNVTTRRQAEAALEQSVSVLQATLESTLDGILVVGSDGKISNFNRRFVEIWHIPDHILETRDDDRAITYVLDQLVNPEAFLAKVRALYRDPEAESMDEIHLKDGRILERYSMPQRLGVASVGRAWSFRDVTARRRAEQSLHESEARLRQAQKMEAVGLLAGGIAHDFNNLLTAIGGYSNLVIDQMAPDHPWRSDLEEIRKAGESAASLTHQLLAFSRRQILRPRILDLNQVVQRMDSLLQRVIGEDVRLTSQLDPSLHRVNVDPGQIEQVIMNLAVNGRDAMPRGGRLAIETVNTDLDAAWLEPYGEARPGRYVMLSLADTGTGIEPDDLLHIFEPFFTTKRPGEGTGLGLATVYGIVKQSGGVITVASAVGTGTTFHIYLPAAVQQKETRVETPAPTAVGGTETILLAEDHEDVRSVARDILVRHGYTVLDAATGEQALRIVAGDGAETRIDLLLTDVVMPQMSGRDLAARLLEVQPQVRVLYSSGYTDDGVMRRGILEAGVDFLQKPFTPSGLLLKVREVLDRPPRR